MANPRHDYAPGLQRLALFSSLAAESESHNAVAVSPTLVVADNGSAKPTPGSLSQIESAQLGLNLDHQRALKEPAAEYSPIIDADREDRPQSTPSPMASAGLMPEAIAAAQRRRKSERLRMVSELWNKLPAAMRDWMPLKIAVVMTGSVALTAFALGLCMLFLTGNHPGGRDFVSYWVAAQQIMHRANPYDGAAVLAIERTAGFPAWGQAMVMRNPPWALCLVVTLGPMGLHAAALEWSCMLAAALSLSVHTLRVMLGRRKNLVHLLAYSFGPALTCIFAGQTALFCLLGLVMFMRFCSSRPFWAGAALWLCMLKPHLFLPFGVVLLMWLSASKSYRIMAGLAAALALSSLLATCIDPQGWREYVQMLHGAGIEAEFVACLSVALRFAIDPDAIWLQYVPAVAGCGWGIAYFRRHRAEWDWIEHGSALMMVSVLVSPYAWVSDQALVIPALLIGAYKASRRQIGTLILASAVIEMQLLCGVTVHSGWVLWTAPVWAGWYVWVIRGQRGAAKVGRVSGNCAWRPAA